MEPSQVKALLQWVTKAGLKGVQEPDLVAGFCDRLVEAGFPLARCNVLVDTLHPVHEGRAFRWWREPGLLQAVVAYGRTNQGGEAAENWRRSPFFRLVETGDTSLRRQLSPGYEPEFPVLEELSREGHTDFVAMIHRFGSEGVVGEMDCVYSSWSCDARAGFCDDHLGVLDQLVPSLALAVKSASMTRIAETLVETYLGRDAGRRVLSGRIARGVSETISAVLWFSDLRGFTQIAETAGPDQILPFLNDYAEAVISSVHEAGGDVLKLIGDGTLAIFKADDPGEACRCALAAEALMRERVGTLNASRGARGHPTTKPYLGLHIGEVFYGNIGSQDRLDFTVVGPAVNEASRIAALCRSVDKEVLLSSAFASATLAGDRARLVSVGRYALKGVERAQELFTLEPDAVPQLD